MTATGNIHFCGVGGQGILLASEVTAAALLKSGLDVKKSEVHGMAQRGGSVEAHLRYGDKVYSPLIDPGTVDIQLAFEMLEALRYLPYLHKKSRVIVNTQQIMPPSVATGKAFYPGQILAQLAERDIEVVAVDGFTIAQKAGNVKAANVVLVGALSVFMPVEEEIFKEVIRQRVPQKFIDVNLAAFAAGRAVAICRG
ncbi:MAG: indolepyruvate oxidoreductase subunit beta [Deltaproteobacteria bacterium]|nr:indolepyruvate oxidoreductase subunit beta [Deltaproteobacteria bacterium]